MPLPNALDCSVICHQTGNLGYIAVASSCPVPSSKVAPRACRDLPKRAHAELSSRLHPNGLNGKTPCDPAAKAAFRLQQSFGQLRLLVGQIPLLGAKLALVREQYGQEQKEYVTLDPDSRHCFWRSASGLDTNSPPLSRRACDYSSFFIVQKGLRLRKSLASLPDATSDLTTVGCII